jgi:hypothetical protein
MLPSQFKRLLELLRTQLGAIDVSLKNQESSIRDTAQSREKKESEIGAAVAIAINTSADTVPQYEQRQRKKEHNLQWGLFWVTLFGAISAAAAAAGAFYYAGIAKGQLGQMKAQTQDTEQTVRLDQQAWVTVNDVKGTVTNNRTMAIVYLVNSGKTPARNLQIWIAGEVSESEPTEIYQKKLPGAGLLGPNVPYRIPLTANGQYSPSQGTIYIHGRAEYRDIFDAPHWTKFCYYWVPADKGFAPCLFHNETDRPQPEK